MENLKELLNDYIVEFTFIKTNGELRKAKGTLNFDKAEGMTENDMPKGICRNNYDVICYWDIDKQGWRSCKENSIVSIDNVI